MSTKSICVFAASMFAAAVGAISITEARFVK